MSGEHLEQTHRHTNKCWNYGPGSDLMHTSGASTKIMKPITEAQKQTDRHNTSIIPGQTHKQTWELQSRYHNLAGK
jgi:hypothetical protein